MEGIDLNFAALAACVLNIKLTRDKALKIMGASEKIATRDVIEDNFAIKDNERDKIEDLYLNDNLTMKEIGTMYNVSQATIGAFMIRHKIKTKGRGRREVVA